jgi:hypothetical protein
VFSTLLGLAAGGAQVVVVAGNHDNARRLATLEPLFARSGVTLLAEVCPPDAGGVHTLRTPAGVPVKVALLPFVSQRGIVRADQLMGDEAFQHAQAYAARLTRLLELLTAGFSADSVNVVAATPTWPAAGPVAASGRRTWWRSTRCRRWPSRPRPATSRSATSTGRSRWPAPPPSTTAGRRSSSTSARSARPSR